MSSTPSRGAIEPMRWGSAHSTLPDGPLAAADVCRSLTSTLGPAPLDLLIFFLSPGHVVAAAGIAEAFKRDLAPRCLIGASGHAVISSSRELESGPALVALGARLPGVELHPFVMLNEAWKETLDDPLELGRMLLEGRQDTRFALADAVEDEVQAHQRLAAAGRAGAQCRRARPVAVGEHLVEGGYA